MAFCCTEVDSATLVRSLELMDSESSGILSHLQPVFLKRNRKAKGSGATEELDCHSLAHYNSLLSFLCRIWCKTNRN